MCGPDPVDSPCRMVYGVAAALLAFSVRCGLFLSFPYRRWAVPDGDFMRWRRLLAAVARLRSASIAQQSGLVVSMSQFNRAELSRGDKLCGLHRCPNPISLSCLSCVEFGSC